MVGPFSHKIMDYGGFIFVVRFLAVGLCAWLVDVISTLSVTLLGDMTTSKSDAVAGSSTRESTEMQSVDDVPFSVIHELFTALRNTRAASKRLNRSQLRNDSRHKILSRAWLQLCRQLQIAKNFLSTRLSDGEIIPAHLLPPAESFKLVSLVVPELDSVHNYFNMKESKLAESFVRALDLPSNSEDALWLKNYKERAYRPTKWQQDASIVDGSLPTVLKAVLHDRCPSVSSLTVGIVWDVLDTLCQSSRVRTGRIMKMSHIKDNEAAAVKDEAGFISSRQRSAAADNEKKFSALTILVQNGTASEVAEVTRIILKDLNIHLSRDNFLNWFHPAAKQHYHQIHDVQQMLLDCYNPNFDIGGAAVQLGQYASVMLTMRPSRKDLPTICEKLRGGLEKDDNMTMDGVFKEPIENPYFIMEPKLDGERLQLHKWKKNDENSDESVEVRTFTRRGNDSSAMYANALFEAINKGVRARDIILDGEIMIWDDLKETWLRFENMREITTAIAQQKVPDGASFILRYMVFDVLYVDQGLKRQSDLSRNGNMVMRLPLQKRRALLEKLIRRTEVPYGAGVKAVVELVSMERGYSEQELTNTLQRYETLGYEGVIAKHPDRPYVLAERSLDIAIKLKPDYFDGGIQDVDVLILGAKLSGSKGHRVQRAGKLSSFLIGVRAFESNPSDWKIREDDHNVRVSKTKWVVIGSVGSGYSDKELEQLRAHCDLEWRDFDSKNLPEHFDKQKCSSTLFSGIAKWIRPENSVSLTVQAYELNRRHNILRFPRVQRINWEKPYHDVATFSDLLDLDENKLPVFVKADEKDVDEVTALPDSKKRKRGGLDSDEEMALKVAKEEGLEIRGGRTGRSVLSTAVGANVSAIEHVSAAFEGLTFHVVNVKQEEKEDLEIKIHELSGRFVQNMTKDVDYVVCTVADIGKVKRLKEQALKLKHNDAGYSIVLNYWVNRCHSKKERVLPKKSEVIFASSSLQAELFKDCDRYGDSWDRPADVRSFQRSIAEVMGSGVQQTEISQDIADRIERCSQKSGLIFRHVVVYARKENVRLLGSIGLLRAHGAKIVSKLDANVTHVLIYSGNDRGNFDGAQVVTEKWVRQCVDSARLIDVQQENVDKVVSSHQISIKSAPSRTESS